MFLTIVLKHDLHNKTFRMTRHEVFRQIIVIIAAVTICNLAKRLGFSGSDVLKSN